MKSCRKSGIKSKNVIDPFEIAKFRPAQLPKFMGPKQAMGFAVIDVERDAFINRILNEGIQVYVVVKTKYLDGFDRHNERSIQMSRQLHLDVAKLHSFRFAGPHNCIDENCK